MVDEDLSKINYQMLKTGRYVRENILAVLIRTWHMQSDSNTTCSVAYYCS